MAHNGELKRPYTEYIKLPHLHKTQKLATLICAVQSNNSGYIQRWLILFCFLSWVMSTWLDLLVGIHNAAPFPLGIFLCMYGICTVQVRCMYGVGVVYLNNFLKKKKKNSPVIYPSPGAGGEPEKYYMSFIKVINKHRPPMCAHEVTHLFLFPQRINPTVKNMLGFQCKLMVFTVYFANSYGSPILFQEVFKIGHKKICWAFDFDYTALIDHYGEK